MNGLLAFVPLSIVVEYLRPIAPSCARSGRWLAPRVDSTAWSSPPESAKLAATRAEGAAGSSRLGLAVDPRRTKG
jgi:hypothetical protein